MLLRQQVTNVPTFSPRMTRFRLCGLLKSKTMIGILLSMHSENAVESITFTCFCNTRRDTKFSRETLLPSDFFFRVAIVNAVHLRSPFMITSAPISFARNAAAVSVENADCPCRRRKSPPGLFPDAAPRDADHERLGDLRHRDRALHARGRAEFFQRVLQRQGVDDGREHAHVIARRALDAALACPLKPRKIFPPPTTTTTCTPSSRTSRICSAMCSTDSGEMPMPLASPSDSPLSLSRMRVNLGFLAEVIKC